MIVGSLRPATGHSATSHAAPIDLGKSVQRGSLFARTLLGKVCVMPAKPVLGQHVHYVAYGTPGGEFPTKCRAAAVTDVPEAHPDPMAATLFVMNPTGVFFNGPLRYEGEMSCQGGTWHYEGDPACTERSD